MEKNWNVANQMGQAKSIFLNVSSLNSSLMYLIRVKIILFHFWKFPKNIASCFDAWNFFLSLWLGFEHLSIKCDGLAHLLIFCQKNLKIR